MTFLAATALVGALLAPTPVAPEYVALGDSYAAGVGAGGSKGACRRTENAHPALYAQGIPSFRFEACSGATTKTVLAKQMRVLTPATTLVTITAGGNDLGFVDVMTECTLGSDRSCTARVRQAADYVRNDLPARLDATYAEIRGLAPNARLVVLGYPRLFTPNAGCRTLSAAKRTVINEAADALAGVLAVHVAKAGGTFVDVRDAFAQHGVCSAEPWINPLVSPTSNSYHPNKAGQLGYLRALRAAAP